MFPDRRQIHYDVWVNAAWGDVTTIHINGHPGRILRADVRDALDAAKAAAEEPVAFGEVQEQIIDGRTGWGWTERMHTDELGLVWLGYRVAVPYDTITYTIELRSGDPALKRNPDTLMAIAGTFGVGEVDWNVPLIVLAILLLAILIQILRKRKREKERRLRGITLKKVEVGADSEEARSSTAETRPYPLEGGTPAAKPGPPDSKPPMGEA